MKIIDKQGRVFGIINILDFIAIILALFLVLLSSLKVMNKQLSDLSTKEEIRTVQVEASVIMDKGYFEAISIGDRLGETKQYLDGEIIDYQILPVNVTNLDANGNAVVSIDPLKEKAIIVFETRVPYKNHIYKFGKQELRQGKTIFLETDLYRYKVQIINVKAVS